MNLMRYPASISDSQAIAHEIERAGAMDSDTGVLRLAGNEIGFWVRQRVPTFEYPWFAVGVKNRYLASASARVLDGEVRHEMTQRAFKSQLKMTVLGDLFTIGPTHHLIGHIRGNESIGAFAFDPLPVQDVAMFPSLWAANAKTQKRLVVRPTHEGEVLGEPNSLQKVQLKSRSRGFISKNFRMTSQSLAAAFVPDAAMGGNAWAALLSEDDVLLKAAVLWLNSALGLLSRTGYAQQTQAGRALIKIKGFGRHPIPNFAEDSDAGEWARLMAEEHFERLAGLELEPAAYAWRDTNRHEIDWAVLEMLGIDSDDARRAVAQIRELCCREPSVHGGNNRIMEALRIAG